jgi:hypothetical protein
MPIQTSQSAAKTFRRCKRQYRYKYIEGLEARLSAPRLKLGNWGHSLLAAYYSGEDWERVHRQLTKQFNLMFIEEREHYGPLPELAEKLFRAYLHQYSKLDAEWEVLYCEEEFTVTFLEGDTFSFTPDLIVKDHSLPKAPIVCVDHKWVKSMPSGEWRIEDLQSTIYPWALRELGIEVERFTFNYIRTKSPSVPKVTQSGAISRARIDTDYYTMAKFLLGYYEVDSVNKLPRNWREQLRALKVKQGFFKRSTIIKDQALISRQIEEFSYTAQEMEIWTDMHHEQDIDPWVRTLIPSCAWDCDFHDLCMVELLGGDGNFMRRSKYQQSEYQRRKKIGK